jgi:hypothetical protein
MLTFESNHDNEQLEIHGDKEGLLKLARILTDVVGGQESQHRHLMTQAWGGSELSGDKQGFDNELYNHVKIFFWNKVI